MCLGVEQFWQPEVGVSECLAEVPQSCARVAVEVGHEGEERVTRLAERAHMQLSVAPWWGAAAMTQTLLQMAIPEGGKTPPLHDLYTTPTRHHLYMSATPLHDVYTTSHLFSTR